MRPHGPLHLAYFDLVVSHSHLATPARPSTADAALLYPPSPGVSDLPVAGRTPAGATAPAPSACLCAGSWQAHINPISPLRPTLFYRKPHNLLPQLEEFQLPNTHFLNKLSSFTHFDHGSTLHHYFGSLPLCHMTSYLHSLMSTTSNLTELHSSSINITAQQSSHLTWSSTLHPTLVQHHIHR